MARVICPFCVKPHDLISPPVCPVTEWPIPNDYVNGYRKAPPLWLVTIGFSQHGKTTYLAALTLMLEELSKVWENVYYVPLDQPTTEKIREMRKEAAVGKLPRPTQMQDQPRLQDLPRPLLLDICDMPRFGSRCLVMHDVAGEVYVSLDKVKEYVPAIKQANTIWFLVSLPDLRDDKDGKTITELFNAYRSGMESLRIDLRGRNLIVVYTKGDELERPADVDEYLMGDPLKGLRCKGMDPSGFQNLSLDDYLEKMDSISKRLETFTRQEVPGGTTFISMVKAKGMNLAFCITSALGESPQKGTKELMNPDGFRYRVLDPFFWALTLEKDTGSKHFGLVLDGSSQSGAVYSEALPTEVWTRLSDYGEITTYFLGKTTPASQHGQKPPDAAPRSARLRLLAPILEQASPDMRFLVISTGKIIDLADFLDSPWQDRIALVTIGEDYEEDWPNAIVHRAGDDPAALVEYLLRLEREGVRA